jgi:hypothetical protein
MIRAWKSAAVAMMVSVLAVIAIALPAGATATPSPQLRKACSAYAKEHFHGVTAHLPDGVKCLEPGEYCSHKRGYARAYREYGFVCRGRLEEL